MRKCVKNLIFHNMIGIVRIASKLLKTVSLLAVRLDLAELSILFYIITRISN